MATWLHDVEVFASLAEGEAGPARDWATARLAIYAPERFSVFPEDARLHDVVYGAAPPQVVSSLIRALAARPVSEDLASGVAAVAVWGLVPEDREPLAAAIRGAIGGHGAMADLWLAYGLAVLDRADRSALAACARCEFPSHDWVLPLVLMQVADKAGAADEAASEVIAQMRADKRPLRLLALLAAMGIPLPTQMIHGKDPDEAARYGAALAHHEPFAVKVAPGSAKRRLQAVTKALLTGVHGAPAALLRASMASDPAPEWGMLPAAVAAWLRARSGVGGDGAHASDPLHDVLFHASAGDPSTMAAARGLVAAEHAPMLRAALERAPEPAAMSLAVALIRSSGSDELARAVMSAHGGDPEADIRSAACAILAACARPDAVPALLNGAAGSDRALGLLVAEFIPSQEVLQALMAMTVPADLTLRRQYTRCLAAMGDAAAVPFLQGVLAHDEPGTHAEAQALAEALLHAPIGEVA